MEINLSEINYIKTRQDRITENGFMLYPPKPNLDNFKQILGLDQLVEQLYLLEYDLTTLCNMLHHAIMYDKKKMEDCKDITNSIKTLTNLGIELDKCIRLLLIRY